MKQRNPIPVVQIFPQWNSKYNYTVLINKLNVMFLNLLILNLASLEIYCGDNFQ